MSNGTDLVSFLATGDRAGQRPWPRFRLTREQWLDLATHLTIAHWPLIGFWAEPREVHAAFLDPAGGAVAVASLPCPDGHFPSLASVRPGALRLERAAQDLFGLEADGIADARPWLDHGQWRRSRQDAPASARPATQYDFLAVTGEGLHQIPVGPVHAGIIEPGHFRFTCNGEAVVRLEQRLGYVHKGTERLMDGKTLAAAAPPSATA
jgi:hypothetical protein